ncbi:MAG: (2Fe-2S)-binding protein [Rhizobiales bacterium]|nr:(2Fe-2S)-binding protein [Hyphomicrobiales bacterium]
MIVCHCNYISTEEIEAVIMDLLETDPWQLIVPLQVYHQLEKRGRCCGCFPNVVNIIVDTVRRYHEQHLTPATEIISLVERIKARHEACITAQRLMRRRVQSAA